MTICKGIEGESHTSQHQCLLAQGRGDPSISSREEGKKTGHTDLKSYMYYKEGHDDMTKL